MLFVVGSAGLAELTLLLDERVDNLPSRLTATVDSARSVLSVVAGATLAFAGVAFSVSLLLISLASSQYSPRVVHGLFRDPFNKRVMGVVIGTFTFCLVAMRAVRGPLEESGNPVVPSITVLVAVLLGVVSVLSIVAFISHSAHSMDVSQILHGVTEEAIEQVRQTWLDNAHRDDEPDQPDPTGHGYAVAFDSHGWVQQIDDQALLAALDPGACLRLDTAPGRYAIPETPICTIWPHPNDKEALIGAVRAAIIIGESRTMQQDVAYGVRQLADVALKALSPGINDPTTAQDALFHLGAVVQEMLVRQPPSQHLVGDGERTILRPQAMTHEEVISIAFDEVRIAAVGQPTVQIYLLEILHLLGLSLHADSTVSAALVRQAGLVLESLQFAELPSADLDRVRAAHHKRFGP